MAISSTKLILLPILLSLSCITGTRAVDSEKILSQCALTHHKDTCVKSLSSHAAEINGSTQKLAAIGLEVSLNTTESIKTNLQKLAGIKGLKAQEYGGLKVCLEELEETVDQLSNSVRELEPLESVEGEDFVWHKNNIVMWTNGALTHVETCSQGFNQTVMDGKIKDTVMSQVNTVEEQIRNGIRFFELFAAERAVKDTTNDL